MGYLICSLKCHILFNSVRKSRLSLVLLLFNLRKHIERIQRIWYYSKVVVLLHCCLQKLLCFVTEITKGFDIYHLEKVYGVINQCIYNQREDYDKTDLVKVILVLNSSTFCHCYAVFVCSGISWLFSIALYCLGVCAQTTTTVRLLPFSLEDVYPSCKTIVVFGIIVGSFCRKKLELEDNGSTHTALSKQLTLVCQ